MSEDGTLPALATADFRQDLAAPFGKVSFSTAADIIYTLYMITVNSSATLVIFMNTKITREACVWL